MKIEEEIFLKTQVNLEKLENYGFKKCEKEYQYSREFMEHFKANIVYTEEKGVKGEIIDLHTNDEYTGFRMEQSKGEFGGRIREAYENILKEIRDNCFESEYFVTPQANRISSLIKEKYNISPEFLWEKYDYGIFRSPKNQKWFGAMIDIDRSKLDKKEKGLVEILNVKKEAEEEPKKKKGIYDAYHMNKKNWISIILDDTLSDTEIMEYVEISYNLINAQAFWIIPANPKIYDIESHFVHQETIDWHTQFNVDIGDIVYIYMTNPDSCILYKCEIINVDFPEHSEENRKKGNMRLKRIKSYNKGDIPIQRLNELGIKSIRGQRKIPPKIASELESMH